MNFLNLYINFHKKILIRYFYLNKLVSRKMIDFIPFYSLLGNSSRQTI